ncbi:MAG: hypothetical protein HY909_31230 [Deltaproteobacteria bacterium]|nr:hypothetical protein [Deltaproteobacteria bacterium]
MIAANVFNPTVFNQTWLVQQKLVNAADVLPGIIITDAFSQVQTSKFTLLVLPQQLQFILTTTEGTAELVADTLGRLVDLVPHTPFLAAGVNFHWYVDPGEEGAPAASRRLFAADQRAVFKHFAGTDARFGAYMSCDVGGGVRLKLDIKPIVLHVQDGGTLDRMLFAFNFHRDVQGSDSIAAMRECFGSWSIFEARSREILADISEFQ